MNLAICGFVFYFAFCLLPMELRAMPQQITKLIPLEDWIAFKCRTNDVKPLDKLLGKLRATYDFVFQKPDNVSNVEKILSENTTENMKEENAAKTILSELQMTENNEGHNENEKPIDDVNDMNVELYPSYNSNIQSTKPSSSISRISKDNEWLDDIKEAEPLSELEIVNDDNIDRSVEIVTQQPSFQLSIAVARAFAKWLGSILGFTRGAYLKLTHSSI